MPLAVLSSIIAPKQLQILADLARNTPFGHFAEIGVFKGGSAFYLYKTALERGNDLHLFDTFCGTPYHTAGLDRHQIDEEFSAKDTPRIIQELMPTAKLHIGTYPETHPVGLAAPEGLAFVHCDCDQYLSYKAVIEKMWPLLVSGGIMLFDDYPYLAGAKAAVEERFNFHSLRKAGERYYAIKPGLGYV